MKVTEITNGRRIEIEPKEWRRLFFGLLVAGLNATELIDSSKLIEDAWERAGWMVTMTEEPQK